MLCGSQGYPNASFLVGDDPNASLLVCIDPNASVLVRDAPYASSPVGEDEG